MCVCVAVVYYGGWYSRNAVEGKTTFTQGHFTHITKIPTLLFWFYELTLYQTLHFIMLSATSLLSDQREENIPKTNVGFFFLVRISILDIYTNLHIFN